MLPPLRGPRMATLAWSSKALTGPRPSPWPGRVSRRLDAARRRLDRSSHGVPRMPRSLHDLEAALNALQSRLPRLGSGQDADFDYEAFQAEAQGLVDDAGELDRLPLQARVSCMLASAGLIPSETEGESCAPGGGAERTAIDQDLASLEAAIPLLQREYQDEFWVAFAGQADVIEDNAGADAAYVEARISEMLAAHGLSDPDEATQP